MKAYRKHIKHVKPINSIIKHLKALKPPKQAERPHKGSHIKGTLQQIFA